MMGEGFAIITLLETGRYMKPSMNLCYKIKTKQNNINNKTQKNVLPLGAIQHGNINKIIVIVF